MFLQFYNYKKFDTVPISFNLYLWNFYFIYLFRAALCSLLLELGNIIC
jgi:hypothetical protein